MWTGRRACSIPSECSGSKLDADFHIVHGIRTRIQNTIRLGERNSTSRWMTWCSARSAAAQVVLDQNQ